MQKTRMKSQTGNANGTETSLVSHFVFWAGKCTDVLCLQIFQEKIFDGPLKQEREMLHLELVKAGSFSPLRCSRSL